MTTIKQGTIVVPLTESALKEFEKDEENKRIANQQKEFNEKVVHMLRESMSKKKKASIKVDDKTRLPIPIDGPHTKISNSKFRHFWAYAISPKEGITIKSFISRLTHYLASPIEPEYQKKIETTKDSHNFTDYYPKRPYGFGMSDNEVRPLMRGYRSGGLLECLERVIDIDESKFITNIKIELVTRGLPSDVTFADSLFILCHHLGKVIFPSISLLKSTEAIISRSAKVARDESIKAFCKRDANTKSLSNSGRYCENMSSFSPFEATIGEIIGNGEFQDRLESMFSNVGWSLVLGVSGIGKTSRVLGACRTFLHNERFQEVKQQASVGASVSDSVSATNAVLDPLVKSASSDMLDIIPKARIAKGIDAIYLDLRGCATKRDVLAAIALQTGIESETLNQLEFFITKFLSFLSEGSVIILDHVNYSACQAMVNIFDTVSKKVALIVVSDSNDENFKNNKSLLLEVLGDRLKGLSKDPKPITIPSLSTKDASNIAGQFLETDVLRPVKETDRKLFINKIMLLANSNPKMMQLLSSVPVAVIEDLVSTKLSKEGIIQPITYEDLISNHRILNNEDQTFIAALSPLHLLQGVAFEKSLAWHLAQEFFDVLQTSWLSSSQDPKSIWEASWEKMLAYHLIRPHYLPNHFIISDYIKHLNPVRFNLDEMKQMNKYYQFCVDKIVSLNNDIKECVVIDNVQSEKSPTSETSISSAAKKISNYASISNKIGSLITLDSYIVHISNFFALWTNKTMKDAVDASINDDSNNTENIGNSPVRKEKSSGLENASNSPKKVKSVVVDDNKKKIVGNFSVARFNPLFEEAIKNSQEEFLKSSSSKVLAHNLLGLLVGNMVDVISARFTPDEMALLASGLCSLIESSSASGDVIVTSIIDKATLLLNANIYDDIENICKQGFYISSTAIPQGKSFEVNFKMNWILGCLNMKKKNWDQACKIFDSIINNFNEIDKVSINVKKTLIECFKNYGDCQVKLYELAKNSKENEGTISQKWKTSITPSSPGVDDANKNYHTAIQSLENVKGLYEKAITYARQLYGPLSLNAIDAVSALGNVHKELNQLKEAKKLFEDAITICQKRAEGPHQRTANAVISLASIYADEQGRESIARILFDEALQMYRSIFPDNHVFVLTTASSLAKYYTLQMRYDRAVHIYEEALVASRRAVASAKTSSDRVREILGTASISIAIASLHDKTGKYSVAAPLYQQAIDTYKDVYGNKHHSVAETMCLLALCIDKLGVGEGETLLDGPKYKEAVQLIENALKIYRDTDLFQSPHMVKAMKQLASIHRRRTNFARARELYDEIMEIYYEVHIGACEELADTHSEYAELLCVSDQHLEGRVLYEQALQIYRKLYGDMSAKVADILIATGTSYLDISFYDDAYPYFDDAIVVCSEVFGKDSVKVADCYSSMGQVLQGLDEYSEAQIAYENALKLYRKHSGHFHENVAKVLNNMGTLMDDMGNFDQAKFLYDHSLAILKSVHGHLHPQILTALENYVPLLEDGGLGEEAKNIESDVIQIHNEEEKTRELTNAPEGENDRYASKGFFTSALDNDDDDDYDYEYENTEERPDNDNDRFGPSINSDQYNPHNDTIANDSNDEDNRSGFEEIEAMQQKEDRCILA